MNQLAVYQHNNLFVLAKPRDFTNHLKAYLDKLDTMFPDKKHNSVITSRTSIDSKELYKLKEEEGIRFAADKFYEMHLAIDQPITEAIDNIFPNVVLPNRPPKDFKRRSELGSALFGSYTEDEIEYKTGISKLRLKALLEQADVITLASEVILIELATQRSKGSLFKQLFKKTKIKAAKK